MFPNATTFMLNVPVYEIFGNTCNSFRNVLPLPVLETRYCVAWHLFPFLRRLLLMCYNMESLIYHQPV